MYLKTNFQKSIYSKRSRNSIDYSRKDICISILCLKTEGWVGSVVKMYEISAKYIGYHQVEKHEAQGP